MKKNLIRVLSMAIILCCVSVFALADGLAGKVYTTSAPSKVGQMNWYIEDTYMLRLLDETNYELVVRRDAFGSEDMDPRGTSLVIFTGTYTDADPEDEETSHRDVTLAPAASIYYAQYGQLFLRSGGQKVLDSANWTDEMTEFYGKDCAGFMEDLAAEMVFVIEEPSLDPEDTSLKSQIYEMPEIKTPAIHG